MLDTCYVGKSSPSGYPLHDEPCSRFNWCCPMSPRHSDLFWTFEAVSSTQHGVSEFHYCCHQSAQCGPRLGLGSLVPVFKAEDVHGLLQRLKRLSVEYIAELTLKCLARFGPLPVALVLCMSLAFWLCVLTVLPIAVSSWGQPPPTDTTNQS
jgi:hypothetical protein